MLPQGENYRTQHIFTYYNICVLGAASVRGCHGTYRVCRHQDDTTAAPMGTPAAHGTPGEESDCPQHEEAGQGGKGGGGAGPHRWFVVPFCVCVVSISSSRRPAGPGMFSFHCSILRDVSSGIGQ